MLTNQTFLVTGASAGLGRQLCLLLAKQGAKLILLSSNERALEQCYDEIVALKQQKPLICSFNLATATGKEYQNLAAQLEQQQVSLDGLIHCAGQLKALTPLEYTPLANWHSLMQINLNARFALSQTCLPYLKKSAAPKIVFLFSDKAFEPGKAHWGAYQVCERASLTLFEMMVDENEHANLKVLALKAPPCKTKLRRQAYPFESQDALYEPHALDNAWLRCLDDKTPHGAIIDGTQPMASECTTP